MTPMYYANIHFRNKFDYRNFFLQQKYLFWVVSPMDPANVHSEIRFETFSATEIIHSLQYPP